MYSSNNYLFALAAIHSVFLCAKSIKKKGSNLDNIFHFYSITANECQSLCGNLEEVTAAHQNLLSLLSDCTRYTLNSNLRL